MRTDIADRADITALVTDFYTRVYADELLGPIFVDVARLDLTAHLPIMCDFWESVLLRAGTYRRNALTPHVALSRRATLERRHFDRWLRLWHDTVDERHAGPLAEQAKRQAVRIAASLRRRLAGGTGSEHVTISPRPA
ncbi:group III truncated hemoglobin [Catellatospora sp. NPDC049609]|uniref:group III truncated hemoglobin n=1 Tax=Catellatospora sp. NPDC049609 TaxID=3155505 RepID=UPI00341C19B8